MLKETHHEGHEEHEEMYHLNNHVHCFKTTVGGISDSASTINAPQPPFFKGGSIWWMRQKDALSPLQVFNHASLHGLFENVLRCHVSNYFFVVFVSFVVKVLFRCRRTVAT